MRRLRAILCLLLTGLVVAPTNGSATGSSRVLAETVAGRCQPLSGTGEDSVEFIDQGGPKHLHLLLDRIVVRPGEILRMAPLNKSRHEVLYGLETAAQNAQTGDSLAGTAFSFLLVGLIADPGEVGPCATLDVPNTAPLGDYEAVLVGVDGAGLSDDDLKAPFTIAGEPLDPGPFVAAGARRVGPNKRRRFSERELNRAADRIARVLRDEPSRNWSVGYGSQRRLELEITELSVSGLDRIDRVASVPVRVTVASGP